MTARPRTITMRRSTTISVSYSEKDELDYAAEQLFGTTEVPYGETITQLITEATDE